MYIHNSLEFEQLPDQCHHSDKDLELLTVLVKLNNQRNFLVSLIYIAPTAENETSINLIKALDYPNKKAYRNAVRIIAGDFNMDYLSDKRQINEGQQLKCLEQYLNVSDHNLVCTIYKKEALTRLKVTFTFRAKNRHNWAILMH